MHCHASSDGNNQKNHGKTQILNFFYEQETWVGSEDQLKTESESDISEDLNKGDYSAVELT